MEYSIFLYFLKKFKINNSIMLIFSKVEFISLVNVVWYFEIIGEESTLIPTPIRINYL